MAEGKKTKAAIAAAYIQLCEEKNGQKLAYKILLYVRVLTAKPFIIIFQIKKHCYAGCI